MRGKEEEVLLDSLVKHGRAELVPDDDWYRRWEPTDAGRLALRLWPATAATPGAGER